MTTRSDKVPSSSVFMTPSPSRPPCSPTCAPSSSAAGRSSGPSTCRPTAPTSRSTPHRDASILQGECRTAGHAKVPERSRPRRRRHDGGGAQRASRASSRRSCPPISRGGASASPRWASASALGRSCGIRRLRSSLRPSGAVDDNMRDAAAQLASRIAARGGPARRRALAALAASAPPPKYPGCVAASRSLKWRRLRAEALRVALMAQVRSDQSEKLARLNTMRARACAVTCRRYELSSSRSHFALPAPLPRTRLTTRPSCPPWRRPRRPSSAAPRGRPRRRGRSG